MSGWHTHYKHVWLVIACMSYIQCQSYYNNTCMDHSTLLKHAFTFHLDFDRSSFILLSAKPNESLKLMLVGLQKMGKTTLLSRLTEVAESPLPATTFSQRVTGTGSDNFIASGAYPKSFALFTNRKLKSGKCDSLLWDGLG